VKPRCIAAAPDPQSTDYFTMALLLAEAQASQADCRWEAFIDNLARITDAFAQARAKGPSKHMFDAEVAVV